MPWGQGYQYSPDEEQIRIITEFSDNRVPLGCIKGFAGSGKTVILKEILKRYVAINRNENACFTTYTNALVDMVREAEDMDDCNVLTHTQFRHDRRAYDLVGVDEVQDIPLQDLQTIKLLSKKLIVCGDFAQSIYAHGSSESEIDNLMRYAVGRELRKVYRTTRKIIDIANHIYPEAKLFAADVGAADLKRGTDVMYKKFDDVREEVMFVWKKAMLAAVPREPSAILVPKHKYILKFIKILASELNLPEPPEKGKKKNKEETPYAQINEFWKEHRIPLQVLVSKDGSFARCKDSPMINLLTYHSSKGMDFGSVFLPFLDDSIDIAWDSIRTEIPDIDKRLFFVASTRSRGDLTYSFTGRKAHPFLQSLIDNELIYEENQVLDDKEEEADDDEFF